MTRGLYLSSAGMIAQEYRVDALANNLANANTPGFQRDAPATRSFHWLLSNAAAPAPPQGTNLSPPAPTSQVPTPFVGLDTRPGPISHTGRPLDLALDGDAYFAVSAPGGTRYTRAGSFTVDRDGILVTPQGDPVLGQSGTIQVKGSRLEVSSEGVVSVDGKAVDRLRVVTLPAGQASRIGATQLLSAAAQPAGPGVKVVQGALQMSNVSAVQEMAALMVATRAYETGQRLLQAQDQTLERAVNDVGRA